MVRRLLVIGFLATSLLVSRNASAITVDQIVSLAKSGATDTMILAVIDRDRTVFTIEPEQIAALQRAGLSERVILAMLRSGRDEGEQAARADSAYNSAWLASSLATEPQSISVGHGPDRPNTSSTDGAYAGPAAGGFYVPFAVGGRSSRGHAGRRPAQQPATAEQPVTVAPPVAEMPLIGAPPVDLVVVAALPRPGQHAARQQSFVCHAVSLGDAAAPPIDFGLRSADEVPPFRADRAALARPRPRAPGAEGRAENAAAEDRRGIHPDDQREPAGPGISTELVDHLPASDTCPSPLEVSRLVAPSVRRAS